MLEELAAEDACKKNGEVCASARVCAAATAVTCIEFLRAVQLGYGDHGIVSYDKLDSYSCGDICSLLCRCSSLWYVAQPGLIHGAK